MTESRTLALARSLTQQVQTTCLVLASSLQGLPAHLQQEALSLGLSRAKGLSLSRVRLDRVRLDRVRDSLDQVMDYMVNNTPLNWLVGPFYPHMVVETPVVSPQDRPVAPPPPMAPPPPEVCEGEEPPQEVS